MYIALYSIIYIYIYICFYIMILSYYIKCIQMLHYIIYISLFLLHTHTHIYICVCIIKSDYIFIEGSLEVKLPTIWTDEKQSRAEAERRGRLEERRSEEKE